MGKKEKLIAKLKSNPKTFTFDDAESLLGYFTYYRSNKGKTSGSRVMFTSDQYKTKILLHKPHPRKELLEYQIKQLIEQLDTIIATIIHMLEIQTYFSPGRRGYRISLVGTQVHSSVPDLWYGYSGVPRSRYSDSSSYDRLSTEYQLLKCWSLSYPRLPG